MSEYLPYIELLTKLAEAAASIWVLWRMAKDNGARKRP